MDPFVAALILSPMGFFQSAYKVFGVYAIIAAITFESSNGQRTAPQSSVCFFQLCFFGRQYTYPTVEPTYPGKVTHVDPNTATAINDKGNVFVLENMLRSKQ